MVYLEHDINWANEGWREDIKLNAKSSWEANIARLLNYKRIDWEYEYEFLPLDLSKEKVKISPIYIPDFTLDDCNIEVKGFWDIRSKAKMKFVKEQYPNKKILVIDCDLYYSISRVYRNIVPNWEYDGVSPTDDTIQVVGITISNRKPFVDALKIDEELMLVRDINNEFDQNAIMVTNQQGNHVGYIARDCANIIAPKLDMGFKYRVIVIRKEPKVIQCNVKLVNKEDIILPEIF